VEEGAAPEFGCGAENGEGSSAADNAVGERLGGPPCRAPNVGGLHVIRPSLAPDRGALDAALRPGGRALGTRARLGRGVGGRFLPAKTLLVAHFGTTLASRAKRSGLQSSPAWSGVPSDLLQSRSTFEGRVKTASAVRERLTRCRMAIPSETSISPCCLRTGGGFGHFRRTLRETVSVPLGSGVAYGRQDFCFSMAFFAR
jgi:hypothetical protein